MLATSHSPCSFFVRHAHSLYAGQASFWWLGRDAEPRYLLRRARKDFNRPDQSRIFGPARSARPECRRGPGEHTLLRRGSVARYPVAPFVGHLDLQLILAR